MKLVAPFARVVVFAGIVALASTLASSAVAAGIASYYPLRVGNAWLYATEKHTKIMHGFEVQETEKLGTIERRVVGPSRLSTKALKVFEVRNTVEERGSSNAPAVTLETILHISSSPSAVLLHAIDASKGAIGPTLQKPVSILHDPPATGPLTSQVGTLTMSATVKSHTVEAIEVPAGKFPKALKKFAEGPISGELSGMRVRSGTVQEISWFVRDVGLVKQERLLDITLRASDGDEFKLSERAEQVLQKFSPGKSD
jgi:hypothetical protein